MIKITERPVFQIDDLFDEDLFYSQVFLTGKIRQDYNPDSQSISRRDVWVFISARLLTPFEWIRRQIIAFKLCSKL